tara:strand:+ start:389 stop:1759 length:1371 start_codon:yes stop_codon:yes gene_type:complete
MPLLDYLKGGAITLSGDPDNVISINPNLYAANGSKGFKYNPTGAPEGGEGPLLGDKVTFSANEDASPTFEYGGGYTRGSVIDNAVRGGTKFNLERRETDFKRLSRFVFKTDQGKQFIAKETALQLLNPFKPKVYNLGAGLLGGEFLQRGTNLMAQIQTAGVSNIKRGGLLPNPGGELFPNQGNYFGGFKKDGLNREGNYNLGGSAEKTDLLNSLIGVSLDDITEFFTGDKGYNISLEDSELKIDKLNQYDVVTSEAKDESLLKDFIPFRFEVINHQNPLKTHVIAFRAFIDSLSDNFSANFNEINYNGRPESFYTYNSFGRTISISFKIAAQTRHEMKPLYKKLNYLVAQTAPGYAGSRMTTPYMRLTVGDWISRTPGVLNSVNCTWQTDYAWEIKLDPEGKDSEMLMLPHVLDVSVEFTPIHDFAPNNTLTDAPYFGISKWLKPSPTKTTEQDEK